MWVLKAGAGGWVMMGVGAQTKALFNHRDQDSIFIHKTEGPASLQGAAAPTTLQPLHKVQTWTVVWHAVSLRKKISSAGPANFESHPAATPFIFGTNFFPRLTSCVEDPYNILQHVPPGLVGPVSLSFPDLDIEFTSTVIFR